MTPETLMHCTGATLERATMFAPFVDAAMAEFGIDTPTRQAAFLAQVGHESGGLHWLVELWGPTAIQGTYEWRADLGNTEQGDGYRFRGRGLLQTTGRQNYRRAGVALGLPLEDHPELLAEPAQAARSAGLFWRDHALNDLADRGDFLKITKVINGGTNGVAERQALWTAAKLELLVP